MQVSYRELRPLLKSIPASRKAKEYFVSLSFCSDMICKQNLSNYPLHKLGMAISQYRDI